VCGRCVYVCLRVCVCVCTAKATIGSSRQPARPCQHDEAGATDGDPQPRTNHRYEGTGSACFMACEAGSVRIMAIVQQMELISMPCIQLDVI
jgi:hypothetical protein